MCSGREQASNILKIMIKEYFKIAVKNLWTRPLRSWLTILGIFIGVFLISSLLSLSEGLKTSVTQQLQGIGTDIIMIMPGDISDIFTTLMGGTKLTEKDIKAVEKTKGVEVVVPMIYTGEVVKYGGSSKTVLLYGMDIRNAQKVYEEDMSLDLAEGRYPVAGRREIIVGAAVPKDIFPGLKLGTQATIKGKKFEIVGILKSTGDKQDDSMVALDIDIFKSITGVKDASMVIAKIAEGFSSDQVAKNIKTNLIETRKRQRGEEEAKFAVLTNEAMSSMVTSIMGIIQVAVMAFASIAVIVGGIGIMNTMYTSVRERTREIGILKAVGAKRSTITLIFLIESGLIGLVGGLGGMILGLGLAKLIELVGQVHPLFYIKASISPFIIIFGMGFSFLIGCLSGFLPARNAASLKPVDALHYE